MRPGTLAKMIKDQPVPLTWALLNLPARLPKGWARVENCHDGGLFEREDGLCVRAAGTQDASSKRWWHVIVGNRDGKPVRRSDLLQVQRMFYPPHAMVLHVMMPHGRKEQDELAPEHEGVEHLWWSLDGGSPLPDLHSWLDEAWVEDS